MRRVDEEDDEEDVDQNYLDDENEDIVDVTPRNYSMRSTLSTHASDTHLNPPPPPPTPPSTMFGASPTASPTGSPPPPPPAGNQRSTKASSPRASKTASRRPHSDSTYAPPQRHTTCFTKFLAGVVLSTTILASLSNIVTVSNSSRYQPLGELFDVGDRNYTYFFQGLYRSRYMHIWCEGSMVDGSPVILFEHGWMGSSMDWSLVRGPMASYTRVCSYDRAGYGWSDQGPEPRTSEQIARETELLLKAAEEYVWDGKGRSKLLLAGHSMAGFQMRIFQDRNPELVGAILFADAVNPDFVPGAGFGNRFPSNPVTYFSFWFIAPSIQPITLYFAPLQMFPDDNKYVPDYNHRYSYIVSRNQWYETAISEWSCWPENAARTSECGTNKDGSLGDLPIHVFVAQKSEAFDSYSETEQLAKISSTSSLTLLADAAHGFIF
eukprot:CAMPEP_0118649694 /NCGR_PEP_ID=MMETSP0785-20121206/9838_1 /TAXON_ID=91992 /ORGANISM="Bolidomonas pacifica, Strain CCMP 1866" /LENGTH=435 /DNA_ID=CAMNT_0006541995 /DNA_START=430 /DNA_END=1734 /DNA_ORIENTATION=-